MRYSSARALSGFLGSILVFILFPTVTSASFIRPPGFPEPWTLVGESEPAPVLNSDYGPDGFAMIIGYPDTLFGSEQSDVGRWNGGPHDREGDWVRGPGEPGFDETVQRLTDGIDELFNMQAGAFESPGGTVTIDPAASGMRLESEWFPNVPLNGLQVDRLRLLYQPTTELPNQIGQFTLQLWAVPEPSTAALVSLGLLGLAGWRRVRA